MTGNKGLKVTQSRVTGKIKGFYVKMFWNILTGTLFLQPINGLAYCVTVALQILVLSVLVRIQVGQQSEGIQPSLFYCICVKPAAQSVSLLTK